MTGQGTHSYQDFSTLRFDFFFLLKFLMFSLELSKKVLNLNLLNKVSRKDGFYHVLVQSNSCKYIINFITNTWY